MAKEKILIIEDDSDIVEMIVYNLKKEGFKTVSASCGEEALSSVMRENPALVILDLMLPGIDGLEVCKKLRANSHTAGLPVIMLTAKSQETDKIVGLEIGADDYVTKPFSPRELIARIKAVLRRREPLPEGKTIEINELVVNTLKYQVSLSGKDIKLTPTEFKLLSYLAEHPGLVLSREKILSRVFGYESDIYDRTVDSHMKALRKKLGQARSYIETIRGVGYRMKEF